MATLALLVGGVVVNRFELDKPTLSIGRKPDNDVQIDDKAVSSRHAVIEKRKSPYIEGLEDIILRDLDSTNGTFVNGQQVRETLLKADDEIRIGWSTFKLMDYGRPDFEATAYILPGEE